MREKRAYHVITFQTTTEAMAMEKFCERKHLSGRMIPVPREISAGCGLAWRVSSEEFPEWLKRVSETSLRYEKVTELMM